MQQAHLSQRNRQVVVMLVVGILIFLRLALSSRLPAYILAGMPHDDGWVVTHAMSIYHGAWLGPYDQYTLIKGAFSPLLLAFSAKLGVTFSGLNTLLYCISSCVFVVSVRPIIKNQFLQIALLAVVLFNPICYALETGQRIYRNGIGQWEILLIFGGFIAMLLRRNDSMKCLSKWSLVCGLSLGVFMQTREDGTWIQPFVLGISISTIIFFLAEKAGSKKKALIFLLPVVFAALLNVAMAFVNYQTYGAPVLNDRSGGNFAKVAGDLYAIMPDAEDDALYTSEEYKKYYYNIYVSTMEKAFLVSPTLNSAEKPIREAISMWASWEEVKNGQVSTDHMLFALRDGVRNAGHYQSLSETEKFYGKVHDELQEAFDKGLLVKHGFPISPLMKRLQHGDISKAFALMPKATKDITTFNGVKSGDLPPRGLPEEVQDFSLIAGGEYNVTQQSRLVGNGWAFAKSDQTRLTVGLYDSNGTLISNLPFQPGGMCLIIWHPMDCNFKMQELPDLHLTLEDTR